MAGYFKERFSDGILDALEVVAITIASGEKTDDRPLRYRQGVPRGYAVLIQASLKFDRAPPPTAFWCFFHFPLAKLICLCYNISCTIFISISRTV
jgi:hypothetical protein